jgi:hypothetical protein
MMRELSRPIFRKKMIEALVFQGVNPYEQLTDEQGKLLPAPLLHLLGRLQSSSIDEGSKISVINDMLSAYEQCYRSDSSEDNIAAARVQREAKKMLSTIGERKGPDFFCCYGPLLSDIYGMLGYDIAAMRKRVYAFLKRDENLSDEAKAGGFAALSVEDRFALACAVSEFTYVLAHTLVGKTVFNIHRFVHEGIILDANGVLKDAEIIFSQQLFQTLKPQAQQQVNITMRIC